MLPSVLHQKIIVLLKGKDITILNSSLFDLAAYNKKSHFNGGQIYH